MSVDNFDYAIGVAEVFLWVKVNDHAFIIGVAYFFFHHTFAHCRHLGTVFGVDDGGHDVAAEGRTNLVQQVGVILIGLGVVVVADFECRAVGSKSAM